MVSTSRLSRVLWKPATGYIAALAIGLAWLFQPKEAPEVELLRETIPYPAAIIDVELPRAVASEAPVYWSPTVDLYVMLRALVMPEGGGHTYSFELTHGPHDSSIILLHDLRHFDSLGYMAFSTLSAVGDFKFKIYDVLGVDTTTRVHAFSIRYESP